MAGPDLSVVTVAVDFSTVLAAVVGVFSAVVVVYVAWKGVKMVLVSVGGGSVSSPLPSASDGWRNFVNGERVTRAELDDISRRHPELREQVRRYSRDAIAKGWF